MLLPEIMKDITWVSFIYLFFFVFQFHSGYWTCTNARHIFLKHGKEDLELSREEGFFLGEGATAKCAVVIRL